MGSIRTKFTGPVIGKRPTVPVLFECRAYKIGKIIDFVVDSGSLFSAITEKEATLMGIDCSFLPDSAIGAIGFGGTFKPKMLNKLVKLTFRSGKNEHTIRYSSGFMVICFPSEQAEREKMLRFTPNVLGMDILVKFRTCIDRHRVELTLIH